MRNVTLYQFLACNVALKIRIDNPDDSVLIIAVEDCHCCKELILDGAQGPVS